MNQILDYLYMCAMESGKNRYLTPAEHRDYLNAAHSIDQLTEQLEQLLKEESLQLFQLYAKTRDKEAHCDDLSTFRKGLVMGLKIGNYCSIER